MSLKTWKAEFYPITAKQAAKQGDIAATKHSLRKWEGALPANLTRHALAVEGTWLGEQSDSEQSLWFDSSTCALCARHVAVKRTCATCPLARTLGQPCCRDGSPYNAMSCTSNPRPMIAALKKTLARLRRVPSGKEDAK